MSSFSILKALHSKLHRGLVGAELESGHGYVTLQVGTRTFAHTEEEERLEASDSKPDAATVKPSSLQGTVRNFESIVLYVV